MNIQDVCEGKYLQLGALVAELNAYYDEGSNCREMNIQDVCEGEYLQLDTRTVSGVGLGGQCY